MIRVVALWMLLLVLAASGCAGHRALFEPPAPPPKRVAALAADGSYLELTDGSLWRPDPGFRARASSWQAGDPVRVMPAPVGRPWWSLTNELRDHQVIAQAPRMVERGSAPPQPPVNRPPDLIPDWLRR